MAFYTHCYNRHRVIAEDDWIGETVECPICQEDFIVAAIDVRDDLPANSEEALRADAFVSIIAGFILAGIGIGLHAWINELIGWILGGVGVLILFRGAVLLWTQRDISRWVVSPIRQLYRYVKYHRRSPKFPKK